MVTFMVNGAAATPDANGNLTLAAGDAVLLSPAEAGFVLGAVSYTPEGGAATDVLPDADGAFGFAIPAVNVTVSTTLVDVRVMYLDEHGAEKYAAAQALTDAYDGATLTGWYFAEGNVPINNQRIEAGVDFKLILCDGANLTAKKGIHVPVNSSLTVYAQSTGDSMGALTIDGNDVDDYNAGIGGNQGQTAGSITIVGGDITAKGGYLGAGIGGGYSGAGGTIMICGGTVAATGSDGFEHNSAGIGGGYSGAGGTITISGNAKVTANGGSACAGIGCGYNEGLNQYVTGGEIKISGGTVTANGGFSGAGIGGGNSGVVDAITITGGKIEAIGGTNAPGFGRDEDASGNYSSSLTMSLTANTDHIKASSYSTKNFTVQVADGCTLKDAATGKYYSGTLDDDQKAAISGNKLILPGTLYPITVESNIPGGNVTASLDRAEEGVKVTLTAIPDSGKVLTELSYTYTESGTRETVAVDDYVTDATTGVSTGSFTMPAADVAVSAVFKDQGDDTVMYLDEHGTKKYAVAKALTDANDKELLDGWFCVKRDVEITQRIWAFDLRLILCDGANLTAPKGIHVPAGSSLTVYAQSTGASMGALTINNVDEYNAGIGGNANESAGTITIVGGTVTANNIQFGASIGGGDGGNGGTVVITGGQVDVFSFGGAGIGGGADGAGGDITITGGQVDASSDEGAGIGPGQNGSGGNITMSLKEDADHIQSSSYGGSVKVAAGCALMDTDDSDKLYTGALDSVQLEGIKEHTLKKGAVYVVAVSATGGAAVADLSTAPAGATVTLTATPDEGKVLASLSYTYEESGAEKTLFVDYATDATTGVSTGSFTMPAADVTVSAVFTDQNAVVQYLDEGGAEKYAYAQALTDAYSGGTLTGWHCVEGDVSIAQQRIEAGADFRLILCDGATLTAPKGIHVPAGGSLTVYAQSTGAGMGALTIDGVDDHNAGIGGNYGQDSGAITIVGGKITATGGDEYWYPNIGDVGGGAGIGGGARANSGKITIYGGDITATSGERAAGIGTGHGIDRNNVGTGCEITIHGGTVTATCGSDGGAGIGGGEYWNNGTIIIDGGDITAFAEYGGAGIGGGAGGDGGNITITNAKVEAKSILSGAGIGGGYGGAGGEITITDSEVTATGEERGAGIGGGENYSGGKITISGGTVTADGRGTATGIGYNTQAAGIGGGNGGAGGNITISGGTVTGIGCSQAAGIGGGNGGAGGTINISGGTVKGNGLANGAGIGGGNGGAGGEITISGGTVEAYGNDGGTGIGGGRDGAGVEITISGGTVTAIGRVGGAGIGGGNGGTGGTINISGGTVTATGMVGGAGIGGGKGKDGGIINITGGTVEANCDSSAQNGCAGIGGGYEGAAGTITITGGTVVTNGGDYGVGIGPGNDGTGGSLTMSLEEYTDYIQASSYGTSDFTVNVAQDKSLKILGTDSVYTGGLDSDAKNEIKGQRLVRGDLQGYVVLIEKPANGTVTADASVCAAGGTVTLTATPEDGFILTELTAAGANDLAEGEDGKWRFTMPADNVTVKATFVDQSAAVRYLDENGAKRYVEAQALTDAYSGETLTGWYCVEGDVSIDDRIQAGADLRLILCDGATLTAKKGIHVPEGSKLTVYAQSTGADMGALTMDRSGVQAGHAGIGSNEDESAGTITIVGGSITAAGGEITANGGVSGAGIGGGNGGAGGTINIIGGTVTAEGGNIIGYDGYGGAGIGGGNGKDGGKITISGGTVTATGGSEAAGIGGGRGGVGGKITISGGTVTATGSTYSAGIGSGNGGAGTSNNGFITISGGTVEAQGGWNGAGIGGGQNGAGTSDGGKITISGGTATAKGGGYASGIGGGQNGAGGTIEITGGVIKATGGWDAPGIGPGDKYSGGSGGSLTMSLERDTDYIWASSYGTYGFTVKVADDKSLKIAGTDKTYTGVLDDNQKEEIKKQPLVRGSLQGYVVLIKKSSNGTVTADHGLCNAGVQVTLTATPNTHYIT